MGIAEANAAGVIKAASMAGLTVRKRAIAPCPACGAEKRGRHDRRGPIGVSANGAGWYCCACGKNGDAIDLVAYAVGGAGFGGLSKNERRKVFGVFEGAGFDGEVKRRVEEVRPLVDVATFYHSLPPEPLSKKLMTRLRERLPPDAIDYLIATDTFRELPSGFNRPVWANHWRSHRLIFPAYDEAGVMRTLRARAISRNEKIKTMAPKFPGSASGAVLTNGVKSNRVVIVEGEYDYMTWAHLARGCTVLGIWAGSLSFGVHKIVPRGANVVVRTHHDEAGEKYFKKVLDLLAFRCNPIRRSKENKW